MPRPRSSSLLLALFAVACLTAPARAAEIFINNGLAPPNPDNVIDGTARDDYFIDDVGCPGCPVPGGPTAVEMVDGARANSIEVSHTSSFTMTGGDVGFGISGYDGSSIQIDGGSADGFSMFGTGTLTITGGTSLGGARVGSAATGIMTGGSITNGFFRVEGTSSLEMSGGTSFGVETSDDAFARITGGLVGEVVAMDASTVEVVGTAFELLDIDYQPIPGPLPDEITGPFQGALIVTLADASEKVFPLLVGSSATVQLTQVPEPTTLALWLAGLTLLAGTATSRDQD
jgi:hypothetical protein